MIWCPQSRHSVRCCVWRIGRVDYVVGMCGDGRGRAHSSVLGTAVRCMQEIPTSAAVVSRSCSPPETHSEPRDSRHRASRVHLSDSHSHTHSSTLRAQTISSSHALRHCTHTPRDLLVGPHGRVFDRHRSSIAAQPEPQAPPHESSLSLNQGGCN